MIRGTAMALACALGLAACERGDARAAGQADFIFSGTNVLPHASTIDVDDATQFAIVQVDEILIGSEAFRVLAGRPVTVWLRQPDRAVAGERRVYFTKAWHWGEDVGVIELRNVAVPTDQGMRAMQADLEGQRQEQADRELATRLRSAELVVIGKVNAVRKADIPPMMTEHDPKWQEAEVEVETVLRGTGAEARATITILFPGTDDPMWYGAPRFATGMEGIWLLHPYTMEGRRLPRLTALQRGDYRARSDEARVRRLLPK